MLSRYGQCFPLALNLAMAFLPAINYAGPLITGKFQWSIQATHSFQFKADRLQMIVVAKNYFMSCTLVLLLTRWLRQAILALFETMMRVLEGFVEGL